MFDRFNGSKWGLWACIILLPAIGVAWSNRSAFPEAFGIATLLLAISVGVSLYTAVKSDEPDKALRQWGLIVEGGLAVAIFANLVCHFQLGREVSAARQGVEEQNVEEDRADGRKNADVRRQALLAEARAKELAALAEQQKVETRLLMQLPTKQRKMAPVSGSVIAAPTAEPSVDPLAAPAPVAASVKTTTPKAVRESWNSLLMWLAAIEAFIAIVGGVILTIMRHWDGNNNGIPDWVERATSSLPDADVQRLFPAYAPQVLALRQVGAMGNV